jgi:hypothetical protein
MMTDMAHTQRCGPQADTPDREVPSAAPNTDEVMMKALGARMGEGNRLLLGRRSHEGMLGYWNTQDGPFKDALDNADKHAGSNRRLVAR